MDFSAFVQIIKRSWWIFVFVFVAVLISSAFFTYSQKPVYRATTTFVVSPEENTIGSDDFIKSLNTLERRSFIATTAEILSSRALQQKAISHLQVPDSQSLFYEIKSSVVPDTNIIRISVKSTNPHLAAEIANAVYDEGQKYIKGFYKYFDLKLLDPATVPSDSDTYSIKRNLSIALVLGVLLGIGAMILIDYLLQLRGTNIR